MTLLLVLPLMDALVPAKGPDGQPAVPRSRIVSDYLPLTAVALGYLAVRRAVLGGIVIAEASSRRSTIRWCRSRRCRSASGWARPAARRS